MHRRVIRGGGGSVFEDEIDDGIVAPPKSGGKKKGEVPKKANGKKGKGSKFSNRDPSIRVEDPQVISANDLVAAAAAFPGQAPPVPKPSVSSPKAAIPKKVSEVSLAPGKAIVAPLVKQPPADCSPAKTVATDEVDGPFSPKVGPSQESPIEEARQDWKKATKADADADEEAEDGNDDRKISELKEQRAKAIIEIRAETKKHSELKRKLAAANRDFLAISNAPVIKKVRGGLGRGPPSCQPKNEGEMKDHLKNLEKLIKFWYL